VNHSRPLVVPNNMQKHGNLLLYWNPIPISDQAPLSKGFD
jgi:hypothetical protein